MDGKLVSHYRILERLGRGGMGEVYLAEDTLLSRHVALKVLRSEIADNPVSIRRLQREARLAAALSHPNIVTIFDVGEQDGAYFIAMEYIEGKTLRQELSNSQLDIESIFSIALQLVSALVVAHGSGIVHRDIKPENIMLRAGNQLKVLDFGLSRESQLVSALVSNQEAATRSLVSMAHEMSGTVGYMSPEQLKGLPVDARSDLFAFGVVLYEMLAGHQPFAANSIAESIHQVLSVDPQSLGHANLAIPTALERIVTRCLKKNSEERYQSASELESDLQTLSQSWQAGQIRTGRLARLLEQIKTGIRRKWWLVCGCALALSFAIFLLKPGHSLQPGSIAALPIQNVSGDPSLDRVAEALSDSLQRNLAGLPGLNVSPASLAERFRGPAVEPLAAGRQLGVGSILTGKLRRRDDNVELDLELTDAQRGSQIWSQNIARKANDSTGLQNDLWTEVTLQLRPKLGIPTQQPHEPPPNSEAFRLYKKGADQLRLPGTHSAELAIQDFQQALEQDRAFARAYAGLAEAYVSIANYGNQSPVTVLPQAISASRRALELDPNLSQANASYAFAIAASDFDWVGAERWFRRAIDLDPKSDRPRSLFAIMVLVPLKRSDEAMIQMRRSIDLSPQKATLHLTLGTVLYFSRRFDEALAANAQVPAAYQPIRSAQDALCWAAKGDPRKVETGLLAAGASVAAPVGQIAQMQRCMLAYAYAQQRNISAARRLDSELEEHATYSYVSPCNRAALKVALHDNDKAFQLLNACYDQRDLFFRFINLDPRYDPLRTDSRFQLLVAKAGLP